MSPSLPPPLLLLLLLLLLLQKNTCTAASSDASWAIVGFNGCNATCGSKTPGTRSLKFGCFASNSSALMPLTGKSPRLHIAKSNAGRLPDDNCSASPRPNIHSVECSAPPHCPTASAASATRSNGTHQWRWNLDSEIRCSSARCSDVGTLIVPFQCVDLATGLATNDAGLCEALEPKPDLLLPCYRWDGCPLWIAGPWGNCSRTCGLGEKTRSVECHQLVDTADGPKYQLRPGQCTHLQKPHARKFCVLKPTCEPHYILSPGKCRVHFSPPGSSEQRLCNETGRMRSRPQCVQLTADLRTLRNATQPVSLNHCSGLLPPVLFTKCQVDDETLREYRIKCISATAAARVPEFHPAASSILVQIERRESLQVECGQVATMIPGTRVRLHCRVANFKPADLRWRRLGHRDGGVAAAATVAACQRRVCLVDGDLIINRFRPKDSGVYEVSAGRVNSSLSLHSHTAYEAYVHAYLPRIMLLMQSNSSATSGLNRLTPLDSPNRDAVLWMPGPWTSCSVPCGGRGRRTRTVHCEQLRSSSYAVVPDETCAKLLGQRPPIEESCGTHTCPVWHTGTWDTECSTSRCYSTGFSLLTRRVKCVNQANETLLDSQCAHQPKPEAVHQCRNELCQPEWRTGPWSKCSVSCGAYGFSSRQIRCVWQKTGGPAGIACEDLELPKGYKACYNGPCERLGCEDLSPVCRIYQASALCAHPSLRRNCCKSCSEYQLHVYRSLQTSKAVSSSSRSSTTA